MTSLAVAALVQLLTGCAGNSAPATGPAAGQVDAPGGETGNAPVEQARVAECAAPGPGWIWCDDFESDRIGRYFEYNSVGGAFIRAAGVGR
ncbi:MAG: hypothetical protein M3303_12275, partial [Gemmatimonadota bacterium]|nr:hypothetical protein [Gemmatimonadota bacterium]